MARVNVGDFMPLITNELKYRVLEKYAVSASSLAGKIID